MAPIERSKRTVTLISSAGLGMRNDPPFRGGDGGYRAIAHTADASDIVMSHVSVNYDRTGFQLDLKINGLPADTMKEAIQQSFDARMKILDAMAEAMPEARSEVKDNAPRIQTIQIDPEKIQDLTADCTISNGNIVYQK